MGGIRGHIGCQELERDIELTLKGIEQTRWHAKNVDAVVRQSRDIQALVGHEAGA